MNQKLTSQNTKSNKAVIVIKNTSINIAIIAIMLCITLVSLNYFGVVQASKVFPFLPLLPIQNQEFRKVDNVQSNSQISETTLSSKKIPQISGSNSDKFVRLLYSGAIEFAVINVRFKAVIDKISKDLAVTTNGQQNQWTLSLKINNELTDLTVSENFDHLQVFQRLNGANYPITLEDLKAGDSVVITSDNDILAQGRPVKITIVRTNSAADK